MSSRVVFVLACFVCASAAFALGYFVRDAGEEVVVAPVTVSERAPVAAASSDCPEVDRDERVRALKTVLQQPKPVRKISAAADRQGTQFHRASMELMALAEEKLNGGPEAQLELLFAFEDVMKMLRTHGVRDEELTRELYPWIKFLVAHEEQMISMTETVFKTMAEDPQALAGLDEGIALEIFTEGVAAILPGAIDEARLEEFRGYADLISERDDDVLPGVKHDVERLRTRFWVQPISREEALEKLRAGAVEDAGDLSRVLNAVSEVDLAGFDVDQLIGPSLEKGQLDAFFMPSRFRLNAEAIAALDRRVARGADAGQINGHLIFLYLESTGRSAWANARTFLDRGLAEGSAPFLEVLMHMDPNGGGPTREHVAALLARSSINEAIKQSIAARYGL
jgi:hypothetical protein